MFTKQCTVTVLLLIVVLVGVLAACAAPAPTPTPTSTLTPTTTPMPVSGPLAQVIEGAKKEGTVTIQLKSTIAPKSMERLNKEIKERFGVDLAISYTPSGTFRIPLAEAMMEHQAGVTPSYDLLTMSDTFIVQGIGAGAYDKVDWKPLLTEDMNPEVVAQNPLIRGAIVNYTGFIGLMYNPEKIRADEVPTTLSDLANPKWKGKIGIRTSPSSWARRAYILNNYQKVVAELRAIMNNKPILGDRYVDMYNRFLLGEVWLAYELTSSYIQMAQGKGQPTEFQTVDYGDLALYCLVLRTGAAHPNAAKLIALYLATPAGVKFMAEEGGAGNLYYPGNFEHDLKLQIERQGFPMYARESYPGLLEWYVAEQNVPWENEIDLILKMGG